MWFVKKSYQHGVSNCLEFLGIFNQSFVNLMKRTSADSLPENDSEAAEMDRFLNNRYTIHGEPTPLINDIIDYIAKLLDPVTRQYLARTSKSMFANFYWEEITTKTDHNAGGYLNLFESLLGSRPYVPIMYLKRLVKYSVPEYPMLRCAFLTKAASTMQHSYSDLTDFVSWLIDIFFYDSTERLILDNDLCRLLLVAFIESDNVYGLEWLESQPWFSKREVIQKDFRHYNVLVGKEGDVTTTNHVIENLLMGTPNAELNSVLFGILRENADNGKKAYDWSRLFSSTDYWRSWWDMWKNMPGYGGLSDFVFIILGSRTINGQIPILQNVIKMWNELNHQTRAEIITWMKHVNIFNCYGPLSMQGTKELVARLIEIGMNECSCILEDTISREFLNAISEEGEPQEMVTWLLDKSGLVFRFTPKPGPKPFSVANIVNWVRSTPNARVWKARGWLNTHPFEHSATIANLLGAIVTRHRVPVLYDLF